MVDEDEGARDGLEQGKLGKVGSPSSGCGSGWWVVGSV
jgi:hypothetical protein